MYKYMFFLIFFVFFTKIYEGKTSENKECDGRFLTYYTQEKLPEISVEKGYLTILPSEMILHVVKFIETEDFKNLCLVNHSFLTHFQNENFLKSYLPILSGCPNEYKSRLLPAESRIAPIWSLFRAATDEKFSNLFNDSYHELKKKFQSDNPDTTILLNQLSFNLNLVPIEISRLQNLQQIYLSHNNLKELPLEFSLLKNLKELTLNNNRFNTFPSPIYDIISLEKLSITSNKIDYISNRISHLINLKYFYFDGNRINELSTNVVYLPNIQRLHFNRNKIKEIQFFDIGISRNLKYLGLLENPLERGFETLETLKNTRNITIVY